jgi:glycosyltransferase involved in cell wall biosynthesis
VGVVRTGALKNRKKKKKICWIVYGSLAERTGGTIYDAKIVSGLTDDIEVIGLRRGEDPSRIVRMRPELIVGDELCHRELATIFQRTFATRVLLVHHLTRWEMELPRSARMRASFYEAQCLRASDLVMTTSQTTKRRLELEGHRGRVDVVLPGSDRLARWENATPKAKLLLPEEGALRLLFVGAVIPRKRVDVLLRATEGVDAISQLVIAGSLERDRAYARRVKELAGDRRVVFLGEIDEKALAIELARADALVMPSSLEGYGIAATEAIHAGTPVIATPAMGLEEALEPCREAVLLDPDLTQSIRRFAGDEQLRVLMKEAAERAVMPTWADAQRAFAASLSTAARIAGVVGVPSIGRPNRMFTSTSR